MASTLICLHVPRFELLCALSGITPADDASAASALALAPAPGQAGLIGEVSGGAQALGVHAGMRPGEAFARAPGLLLIAPDPVGVAAMWERLACLVEGIGAAPELERPGIAYFRADPLYRLYGGLDGVIAGVCKALDRQVHMGRMGRQASGCEAPSRQASAMGMMFGALCAQARLGTGPTRLCAFVMAHRAQRRCPVAPFRGSAKHFLAPLSIDLLALHDQSKELIEPLKRLGICTLGELASLPRAAVADRFGKRGLLAHELACGREERLRERPVAERIWESLALEGSTTGPALERALGVLIDRMLARPERRSRTVRAFVLAARLVEGGTWRERVLLRQASAERARIYITLAPRLALLPAPAHVLALGIERFGMLDMQQQALLEEDRSQRRERLREAARQVRAGAGPEGALRVTAVQESSRVPERRFTLTPFS